MDCVAESGLLSAANGRSGTPGGHYCYPAARMGARCHSDGHSPNRHTRQFARLAVADRVPAVSYARRMPRTRVHGDWRVLQRLGGGGNGGVYRCLGADDREAAIKVLKRERNRRDRITRFRSEIRFLLSHGQRPGVLPLLDHELPDDPRQPSWYVMPLAVSMTTALGASPPLVRVVEAITKTAETLADLVHDGISHRDIKPDNLFQLNDDWAIGDFGLVKYPDQEPVTRPGRPVGPYFFMAPEMRQRADTANAELADVYSLVKTLWALAAGQGDPPPGELRRDRPEHQLGRHSPDPRAFLLEPLLERGTADDPTKRPSMREVAQELAWWSEPTVPPRP